MSHRTLSMDFFTRPLQRHLELAEREPALTEILYDGDGRTVIDIGGVLHADEDSKLDDKLIMDLGALAASYSGQRLSEDNPSLSIVVPPDWRVTILRSPVVEYPIMAMRKLRRVPIPLANWVMKDELGTRAEGAVAPEEAPAPPSMRERLRWLVAQRKTVAISGEVGSGKTSLLRLMLSMVPLHERIIVIEEPRELMLTEGDGTVRRRNYVALEAKAHVRRMDELLRDALRLRPDRIILGEARGPEALELFRALNVGHAGSMFTLHSNGAEDLINRMHTLVVEAQSAVQRESIARAIDAVVQITGRGSTRMIADIWPPTLFQ